MRYVFIALFALGVLWAFNYRGEHRKIEAAAAAAEAAKKDPQRDAYMNACMNLLAGQGVGMLTRIVKCSDAYHLRH